MFWSHFFFKPLFFGSWKNPTPFAPVFVKELLLAIIYTPSHFKSRKTAFLIQPNSFHFTIQLLLFVLIFFTKFFNMQVYRHKLKLYLKRALICKQKEKNQKEKNILLYTNLNICKFQSFKNKDNIFWPNHSFKEIHPCNHQIFSWFSHFPWLSQYVNVAGEWLETKTPAFYNCSKNSFWAYFLAKIPIYPVVVQILIIYHLDFFLLNLCFERDCQI